MIATSWPWLKFFSLLPVFGQLPPPLPYILARYLSRLEYRCDSGRREAARSAMARWLGGPDASPARTESVRRYFEIAACDEMDLFIYLSVFSGRMKKRVKVDGEEHLTEAIGQTGERSGERRGGILLSAHYGGGFWILPYLRDRGIAGRFFSADIREEDYPSRKAQYLYNRLRSRAVVKASGKGVLYKGEGGQGLRRALEGGEWVILLLDVPPVLVRQTTETVFFGKRARFPSGIVSIAKEVHVPILPFFSFLDGGKTRRICFEKSFHVNNVKEAFERCVRLIESKIMERPDHWLFWPIADQFLAS